MSDFHTYPSSHTTHPHPPSTPYFDMSGVNISARPRGSLANAIPSQWGDGSYSHPSYAEPRDQQYQRQAHEPQRRQQPQLWPPASTASTSTSYALPHTNASFAEYSNVRARSPERLGSAMNANKTWGSVSSGCGGEYGALGLGFTVPTGTSSSSASGYAHAPTTTPYASVPTSPMSCYTSPTTSSCSSSFAIPASSTTTSPSSSSSSHTSTTSTNSTSPSPRSSAPTSRASSTKPRPSRGSSTRPSPTPKLELSSGGCGGDNGGGVLGVVGCAGFVMESIPSASPSSSSSSPSSSSNGSSNGTHQTSSCTSTGPPGEMTLLLGGDALAGGGHHPAAFTGVTLPMEVPLRATQATGDMRRMMTVFRLNPFASSSFSASHPSQQQRRSGSVSSSSSSGGGGIGGSEDGGAGLECSGGGTGERGEGTGGGGGGGVDTPPPYAAQPLEEEPQMFEFQVELDDPEMLVPLHDRVGLLSAAVSTSVSLSSPTTSAGHHKYSSQPGSANNLKHHAQDSHYAAGAVVYATHQDAMVASPLSSPGLEMLDMIGGNGSGSGSGSSGEESPVDVEVDVDVDVEGNGGLHVFPEGFEPNSSVGGEYAAAGVYGYGSQHQQQHQHQQGKGGSRDGGGYAYHGYVHGHTQQGYAVQSYAGTNDVDSYARGLQYAQRDEGGPSRSRTGSPNLGGRDAAGMGVGVGVGTGGATVQRGLSVDNAELYAGSQNTAFYAPTTSQPPPSSSSHAHSTHNSLLAHSTHSGHGHGQGVHPSRRWSLPSQNEGQPGVMGHAGQQGYGVGVAVYGR